MKRAERIWLLLIGVAMLTILSASSASAKDCGDANRPAHPIDVPCDCGDTVTRNTDLDASDPVIRKVCTVATGSAALFVAANVNLDMSMARIRCERNQGLVGIFILGNGVTVDGGSGLIQDCTTGIFGFTNRSTIERVRQAGGELGFFLIGDRNKVAHNLCNDNGPTFGGMFIVGDDNLVNRNYCRDNSGDGIAVTGDRNIVTHNVCHNNGDRGIFVLGDDNLLKSNNCQQNAHDGISVTGIFNQLGSNQGHRNGGHGIFAPGNNFSDGSNYATKNKVEPDCVIDGSSGTRC